MLCIRACSKVPPRGSCGLPSQFTPLAYSIFDGTILFLELILRDSLIGIWIGSTFPGSGVNFSLERNSGWRSTVAAGEDKILQQSYIGQDKFDENQEDEKREAAEGSHLLKRPMSIRSSNLLAV